MLRPNSKVDKATVGSYIRLFESLVIKSLKLYNTSSLALQEQVLDLLTQLLLLRVNYNLLDADQVHILYSCPTLRLLLTLHVQCIVCIAYLLKADTVC